MEKNLSGLHLMIKRFLLSILKKLLKNLLEGK